ncbi:MAG: flagellar biosynthesis protein FlhF-like protein, partial [Pseudomonadota bacterium]
MRMKMFAAESADAARALVFAEMGEGAVILSEREVDGRFEVRAATDGGKRKADKPLFLRGSDRDEAPSTVLSYRLRDTLTWHGAPRRFVDRIIGGVDTELSDPSEALASGLEGILKCDPLTARPEKDILLVGPPGHGRTSTVAKLTRRAAVAETEILPVAADFDATAGGEQLSAYLEMERAQVRIAPEPDALFALLEEARRHDQRCIIDLPAIIPFDQED